MPDQHGPRLETPEPYYTCRGCEYYMAAAYWENGELPHCRANGKEITNQTLCNDRQSPSWCPLLPKDEPVTTKETKGE